MATPINKSKLSTHTVLLVDDDADFRSIVRDMLNLRRPDITVLEANDGQQALTLLGLEDTDYECVKPAVIVMDLEMPCMDGGVTIKRIRQNDHLDSIKILILSGETLETQKQSTGGIANDYMGKSTELEKLDELVKLAASYCDNAIEAKSQNDPATNNNSGRPSDD